MIRWMIVGVVLMALGIGAWLLMRSTGSGQEQPGNPVATAFVAHFIDEDGRVADTANGGTSHSEGQGYGLLLAVSANDRQAFDRVLNWTEAHLGVRDDGLFSWRWDPVAGAVTDPNNASDGDILIAWALLRAHDRWGEGVYRQRALEILASVEDLLLRPSPFGPVLLPGRAGFESDDGVVVNLSYWIFPALERFAAEGLPIWREVAEAGYALVERAGFGQYELAADWTRIGAEGGLQPADGWPAEFGYNAVRVPLHLCWAGPTTTTPDVRANLLARYARFWADVPAASSDRWDVETDQSAGGPAPAAYTSIANLTAACERDAQGFPLPLIDTDEAYYSAALKGLVSIAVLDMQTTPQK